MVLALRSWEAGGSGIQNNPQLYREIASSLRKKRKKGILFSYSEDEIRGCLSFPVPDDKREN